MTQNRCASPAAGRRLAHGKEMGKCRAYVVFIYCAADTNIELLYWGYEYFTAIFNVFRVRVCVMMNACRAEA